MAMSKKKRTQFWLLVGAVILIVLLFIWLTFADLAGDTDVSAQISVVKSIFNA